MKENPLGVFGSVPLAIDADRYDRPYGNQKPYAVDDGIAVIDISGALAKNANWLDKLIFGATSYTDIEDQLEMAVEDSEVKGILLRFNSPGGTVAGMFQCQRAIAAANKEKTIYSVGDDMMCSAAYALGSGSEKVFINPETGILGSVGVIAQRVDVTGMDEENGIKVHFIKSGKKKGFGNPHTKMSPEEQEAIQADVDRLAGMFFDVVAKNRNLTVAKVRGFEAGVFTGADAVKAGLADFEGTYADAMNALRKHVANKKAKGMTASAAMTPTEEAHVETPETQAQEQAAGVDATATATGAVAAEGADPNPGTPAAPAPAAPAAEQAESYDSVAIEVAQLCALAGKTDLLADFIMQRTPAADVRKALVAAKAVAQSPAQIRSGVMPNDGLGVDTKSIEDNPVVKAIEARFGKAATEGAK